MGAALYFPFSRCLNDLALKRALLLYDEVLFLDPVPPHVRSLLYSRPGTSASQELRLADRWRAAESHYELLQREGLIDIIDPEALLNLNDAEDVIVRGLEVDLALNRQNRLFRTRQKWQVLERRLPHAALAGPLAQQLRAVPGSQWEGPEAVVRVPYAVGSSLNLTFALAASHAAGTTLMTDSVPHHELLLFRLRQGANQPVPSMAVPAPSPYRNQQIALQVIGTLVPDASLQRMSFGELIDFRHENAVARGELAKWIGEIAIQAEARDWDAALNQQVADIVRHAKLIAEQPARWRTALSNTVQAAPGDLLGGALAMLTAVLTPGGSALAGLLAGGGAYTGPAASRFMSDLRAKRPPGHTAVSYLLAAARRAGR